MKQSSLTTKGSHGFMRGVASVIDVAGVGFVGYRIPRRRKSRNQVLAARWRKLGDRLSVTIERSAGSLAKQNQRLMP